MKDYLATHIFKSEEMKKKFHEVVSSTSPEDLKKGVTGDKAICHMTKMGVPANRIVKETSPYVAKNLLKKFGDDTAVVYIFGKKDAGRLSGCK